MNAKRKTSPTEQFRAAAEALATGLSTVLTKMDERDEAELAVETLRAELATAEAKLAIFERRYEMTRDMMEPQHRLQLSVMEDECRAHIASLAGDADV